MGAPDKLRIQNILIDNTTWYPVTSSWACNYWVAIPNVDCLVCSDPTDPTSVDTCDKNSQYGVESGVFVGNPADTRYVAEETLLYIQTVQGTGTVILRSLK